MPRAKKPQAPGVRSDGEATAGTLVNSGAQPNGRPPRGAVTQASAGAGAGGPMVQGEIGQLQSAAAQTAPPPGVPMAAHMVRQSVVNHMNTNPVTPLFAPTQNPLEDVTAGSPMSNGPTNPMAMGPASSAPSVAAILQQAAQAAPSPSLRALAQRASASLADQGSPGAMV